MDRKKSSTTRVSPFDIPLKVLFSLLSCLWNGYGATQGDGFLITSPFKTFSILVTRVLNT